jgi:hypothetical protein
MPAYGSQVTLDAIRRTFWYVFEDVEAGGASQPGSAPGVGPLRLFGRTIVPVPLQHGACRSSGIARAGSPT